MPTFIDTFPVKQLTTAVIQRLIDEMHATAPGMAARAEAWMSALTRTGTAADYFQHPLAFPMLLLPGYVEESLRGTVDVEFQSSLIYSSVSGYYFIRLVDNVMDEQSEPDRRLLPMTGFFHACATTTYHRYFDYHHPFWTCFFRWNTQSAHFAIEDGIHREIDLETFRRVAGQKVVAGKIPIAAVLARYDRLEKLPDWEQFYDQLSCWHQMLNDVLSWHKDIQHQTASYFLGEGQRRKDAGETLFAWLIREGFAWGFEVLHRWLDELLRLAEPLNSLRLNHYLINRRQMLEAQKIDLTASVAAMARLMHIGKSSVSEGEEA